MTTAAPTWSLSSLGSLASYLNGRSFGPEDWGVEGLPIVRIEQLLNPKADTDFFSGVLEAKNRIDTGDLVFSWSATLAIRQWDRGPAALNQHLFKVIPKAGVNPRFLHHLIEFHIEDLAEQSHGSTMRHIKRGDLAAFPVYIPEEPEQARIAEVLDSLDEAIQLTKAGITKQSNMGRGYLLDLLTCGVGEDGELRSSRCHPDQFKNSPVGRIPRSWTTQPLAELASTIVDGVHHTPTYVENGVPFLTVENLTRGDGISFSPCRYVSERAHLDYCSRAHPEVGDVLVSKDGTLGVARVVPPGSPEFSIFVSIALLRPRANLMEAELIREFFNTPWFEKQLGWLSAGTGLKHIHLEHFRAFLLPVPPLSEQQVIVDKLTAFHESRRREELVLARLESLKSGLSTDLLTGRVRTRSH
jgi:type I restriction enzyme, S subunit